MAPLAKLKLIALPLPLAFIFLIINSSSHGTANAVFVSLDCGMTGSSGYKDGNTIVWSGDDAYVNKQQSKVYQYSDNAEGDSRNTARVFPTSAKNCYTIPIDKASRGKRLLVRASFYYWNFDDTTPSPDPPTFELDYDGNFWTSVVTQLLTSVSYEAIYFVQAETTSICLSKTKTDQLPFISALEFRSLDVNVYSLVDPNSAMLLTDTNRRAFGTNQTVRYPDDAYDRIWGAYVGGLFAEDVKSEAVSIDTSSARDNPPVAVLQNALQGTATFVYVSIDTSGLPQQNVGIYLIIYFSEVIRVGSTDKRSFQVFFDGNPYTGPIIPPFGGVSTVYITNVTAYSNTNITIQVTADSTLPPLINAYELYTLTGTQTILSSSPPPPRSVPQLSPPPTDSTPSSPPPPRSVPQLSPPPTDSKPSSPPPPVPQLSPPPTDSTPSSRPPPRSVPQLSPPPTNSTPSSPLPPRSVPQVSPPPTDSTPSSPPPPSSVPQVSSPPAYSKPPPSLIPQVSPTPADSTPPPPSVPQLSAPPPEQQTPSSSGPSQIPNGIPFASGGCSDKVQMILGVIIHISLLSFIYVQ